MNKPECVTYEDGFEEWRLDGELHREDGPAIEYVNGDKGWYLNGWPHREDGPAIEYADGNKQWWLNGVRTDPEAVVDLWLMRGKFCFYDKVNDCLNFG
tara:strand:- start:1932 stop:2225 length:294 start_codon:yes stop_codon:yes gene_type:complete